MVDYQNYKLEDFLEDDFFINWVLNPTGDSIKFWDNFLNDQPQKKLILKNAKTIIKFFAPVDVKLSPEEIKELWKNINSSTISRKIKIRRWTYIAAACTILAVIGSLLFTLTNWDRDKEINYAGIKRNALHSDKIKLILADNSEMDLSQTETELIYDANGKLIVNSQNLDLEKSRNKKQEIQFNQLIIPRGKRSSILFSDGSKIWLNSGSRAIYPTEFKKNKREIFVEGEAYLEISHDTMRSFIVKTAQIDVQVLGTSFNISAYPGDSIADVVLVRGSVKAIFKNNKEQMLSPNHMISYSLHTDRVEVKEVDVFEYISWKDGWLLCNSEILENVFEKLSRYYNREVNFLDSSAKSLKISGKLDLKEDIEQVLHVISSTAPIKVELKNEKIYVSSK